MPSASYRPRLRDEIQRHDQEQRPFLHDALLDRRVDLGGVALRVVPLLDGTRTVDDIEREIGAIDGGRERLERTLRTFLLLGLCDGAGDGVRAHIGRLKRGEEALDYSVLDGARFECQGSGACCQNYWLGPIDVEDMERIEALDLAGRLPEVGSGPYFVTRRDDDGDELHFLATRDERCVFLRDDLKCSLHAVFGPDSKPAMCRTYPIESVATIDGIKLYDKGSCASFAVSARRGLPILEDAPRLRRLLGGRHSLHHPIAVLPGIVCDYGVYLTLVKPLLPMLRGALGTPAETIRAVGRAITMFADALDGCPVEAGQPDTTAALASARILAGRGALLAPPDDPIAARRAGVGALASLLGELLEASHAMIAARHRARHDLLSSRLQRELAQLLHLMQGVYLHEGDPSVALPDWYARVAATRLVDPDRDEVLRLSLRQQMFGSRSLVDDCALPAILRMAMMQLVAIWGAKLRAAVDDREARAEDLSFGHMLAARVLDLDAAREALVRAKDTHAILEALPLLMDPPGGPA